MSKPTTQTLQVGRVNRVHPNTPTAPFGYWQHPSSVEALSTAPCYPPYGEPCPPSTVAAKSEPASTPLTSSGSSDPPLRRWERGTKTGKRVKRGRKPKASSSRLAQVGKSEACGFDGTHDVSGNSSSASNSGSSTWSTSSSSTVSASTSQVQETHERNVAVSCHLFTPSPLPEHANSIPYSALPEHQHGIDGVPLPLQTMLPSPLPTRAATPGSRSKVFVFLHVRCISD